jgi:hypothetical protein
MTRTRLIVGLITHIVIYVTVTKPVREAKARLWAVAPLMMIDEAIKYENWRLAQIVVTFVTVNI